MMSDANISNGASRQATPQPSTQPQQRTAQRRSLNMPKVGFVLLTVSLIANIVSGGYIARRYLPRLAGGGAAFDAMPAIKPAENLNAGTPSPTPALTLKTLRVPFDPVYDCTGQVIADREAGFSVQCPQGMKWYVRDNRAWGEPGKETRTKTVVLCETNMEKKVHYLGYEDIDSGPHGGFLDCDAGWLEIELNPDAVGNWYSENCDQGSMLSVEVDGKSRSACFGAPGVMHSLWVSSLNHNDRYAIHATFSQGFTREKVVTLLKTFRVL